VATTRQIKMAQVLGGDVSKMSDAQASKEIEALLKDKVKQRVADLENLGYVRGAKVTANGLVRTIVRLVPDGEFDASVSVRFEETEGSVILMDRSGDVRWSLVV
jgi:hypothetical protein